MMDESESSTKRRRLDVASLASTSYNDSGTHSQSSPNVAPVTPESTNSAPSSFDDVMNIEAPAAVVSDIFQVLFSCSVMEYLKAYYSEGEDRTLWKKLCSEAHLSSETPQSKHFGDCMAMVLEESRFSVSELLGKLLTPNGQWRVPQRDKRAVDVSMKVKECPDKNNGNMVVSMTPQLDPSSSRLTKEQASVLTHGHLFLLFPQGQLDPSGLFLASFVHWNKEKSFIVHTSRFDFNLGQTWTLWPLDQWVHPSREFSACAGLAAESDFALLPAFLGKEAKSTVSSPSTRHSSPATPSSQVEPSREFPLLNHSQREAAIAYLSSTTGSITIVQGPPGTGKTSLLVSTIQQHVKEDKGKLMVCAHTNKAVRILAGRFWNADKDSRMLLVGSRLLEENDPLEETLLSSWFPVLRRQVDSIENDSDGIPRLKRIRYRLEKSLRFLPPDLLEAMDGLRFGLEKRDHIGELRNSVLQQLDLMYDPSNWHSVNRVKKELLNNVGAEALIVDEAACATEPSIYIPVCHHRPSRLMVVGDPKQLPATVRSDHARQLGYAQSLQERLMKKYKRPYHLLDTQYRMHPEISMMPVRQYYEGKVTNGSNVLANDFGKETRGDSAAYTFVEVNHANQVVGQSLQNEGEAKAVLSMLDQIQSAEDPLWATKVRVVTFYRAQVALIRKTIKGRAWAKDVIVSTVDSCQGSEADRVIVSFVRSGGASAGFLRDDRRLNVAMTRARHQLICVGNAHHLACLPRRCDESVRVLSRDAFERRLVFSQLSEGPF